MKKLYSVREVAEILGITESGVYKLIQRNKIKYRKPNGKKIYFTENDLEVFVFGKEAVNV